MKTIRIPTTNMDLSCTADGCIHLVGGWDAQSSIPETRQKTNFRRSDSKLPFCRLHDIRCEHGTPSQEKKSHPVCLAPASPGAHPSHHPHQLPLTFRITRISGEKGE